MCKNKNDGSFGIRKSRFMNQALLVKATWKIYSGSQGTWASIFQSKYLKIPKAFNASHAWRSIRFGADLAKMELGGFRDGFKTRFWLDDWIGEGSLLDKLSAPYQTQIDRPRIH